MQRIKVGTQQLGIAEFQRLLFAPNASVDIDDTALRKVENNHEFLKQFAVNKVIYGVNTGFGPMAQYIIGPQDIQALQYNLIRSHATGMGQLIPPLYVKAIMIARLNTLMLARSGVHGSTVLLLSQMINRDICPCIYDHGSVGASGDL
ncbi:MAG: aromatic amino acid lyase, partial [Saprospiraceae bacterium]|nr:aromatic amino acid lyase [Saprospiraceae bacterium]